MEQASIRRGAKLAMVSLGVMAAAMSCEGDEECPAGPSDYDPVPVAETPPLPDDACSDPPSPASQVIEMASSQSLMEAAATNNELRDPTRITVVTCGTGSPVPSDRAQACTAVFVAGQFLLFDAGDGAQPSMEALNLPVVDITAAFLTHFHSDHMADLGEVISRSWILGRTSTLPVYGGPSIERVVDGFNLVYSADEQYRRAHHGQDVFPSDAPLPAEARRIEGATVEGQVVYEVDGVVVKAYAVDHSPVAPALGYRVEYAGRSVAISGDTVDGSGLRALAQGADILVAEVMDKGFALDTACAFDRLGEERTAQIFRDIRTYHVDMAELAQVAQNAGVGKLVLTHMVPSLPPNQAETFFTAPIAAIFTNEIVVPEDGTRITVDVQ